MQTAGLLFQIEKCICCADAMPFLLFWIQIPVLTHKFQNNEQTTNRMENRQKKNLENNADTSFSRLVWYGTYGIRTRDPHTARGRKGFLFHFI